MNWTAIENALHAWAVAGSGYAAQKVIWSMQEGPRPTGPYIALRLATIDGIGQDWTDYENIDEPEEGAELRVYARGMREATLTFQAFAGVDGVSTGAAMPLAVLNAVTSAAKLPSVRSALQAAGVGIGEINAAQALEGSLGQAVLEPRAVMEARLFLASEIQETATYIQHVRLENISTGASTWVPEEPA
jgi:hypothetical protein